MLRDDQRIVAVLIQINGQHTANAASSESPSAPRKRYNQGW